MYGGGRLLGDKAVGLKLWDNMLDLSKLEITQRDWITQNPTLYRYVKRGFVETEQDASNLHQYHSPYRIPKGLTKLQIRRRINHFRKHGNTLTIKEILGYRVSLLVDGRLLLGASFRGKKPEDNKGLRKLLKNLLEITDPKNRVKDRYDPILGKYSPKRPKL